MAESVSSSSSHGGQHQLPVKLNQEYRVKLGRTFTFPKENAFHTIKYDFKPKSVDESKPGRMKVSGDEVSVSLPVTQAESESDVVLFKGAKRTCTKECILIINTITGEAILEKISNTVQLKGVRDIKKKKHPRSVSPIPSQIKALKVSSAKQTESSTPSSSGKKAKRLKKSSPSSAAATAPPPPLSTSTAPPVSSKSQNSSSNTSSKSLNPPPPSSSSSSFLALPDSISPLRSNNPTPEPPPLFASQPKRKKGLPSSNSSSSSSSSDSSSSSGSDSETEFVTVPTLSSAPPPQVSLSSMPQFTTSAVIQQPIPTAVVGGGGPMGYQVLPSQHGSGLSSNNNGAHQTAGGSLSDTSSSSSSEGEDDSSSSDSEKDVPVPSQHQTVTNPTGVDIRQRSMSVLKRDLEMSESDSD